MNLWFNKSDFVGKSIKDLSDLCHSQGICIFDINKPEGCRYGGWIWEDIYIKDFIKKFPHYNNAVVVDYNDFFGEIVLRVRNTYTFKGSG